MKSGDLVVFPGVADDQQLIGMVVEIYKRKPPNMAGARRASELLVDVLWPDGDLIRGYLARDFEVINESR